MEDFSLDEKTQRLIDCILNAATGDHTAFFNSSPDGDSIDAIGIAYNSFLEEVRFAHDRREQDLLAWRRALHDIRGPIGSIPQLIEAMAAGKASGTMDDHMTQQLMASIVASCKVMLMKINNAMTGAYVEGIRTEKIFVQELVNEVLVLSMITELSDDFNITVDIEDDFLLFSDRNLLLSIFKNVIENSFKYRKDAVSGYLKIQAFVAAGKNIIRFSDNGLGIAPESISRIFQAYTQLSESSDGFGYGLYSVKRDVEALGGEISVASKPGEGFTIEIRLNKLVDSNAFRRKENVI